MIGLRSEHCGCSVDPGTEAKPRARAKKVNMCTKRRTCAHAREPAQVRPRLAVCTRSQRVQGPERKRAEDPC